MKFHDKVLNSLNLNKPESILLLTGYLRGDLSTTNNELEQCDYITKNKHNFPQLEKIINKNKKIDYPQLNEIFLIFDKQRISKGFFYFFFVPESVWKDNCSIDEKNECHPIKRREFRSGVIKFRGFALLKYGNFRFAHKVLREMTLNQIIQELQPYSTPNETLLSCYKNREKKAIDIKMIKKEDTWLGGYLSAQELKEDLKLLHATGKKINPRKFNTREIQNDLKESEIEKTQIIKLAERIPDEQLNSWKPRLPSINKKLGQLKRLRKNVINHAIYNSDIYLTWDYMDIYIATSMRSKWEFQSAFDLIDKVFDKSGLSQWDLRYFDPTQSFTDLRLNKGVIESLMLKRACLTIYHVQESDSLGKDSELAATLAQGKPVIAYVPKIKKGEIQDYADRIMERPLIYFYRRFLAMHADEIQKCDEAQEYLEKRFKSDVNKIENLFFYNLKDYITKLRFRIDLEDEKIFKNNPENQFARMCEYVAILEAKNFDKRAETLGKLHPLSIQVNLSTGVANGLLVAREYDECVNLIKGLLTNNLEFNIIYYTKGNPKNVVDLKKKSITILQEKSSKCPYRIVTADEKITNSFWNFYLK